MKKNHFLINNSIYLIIGIITPIPIFLIPNEPYIFFNFIENNPLWVEKKIIPYPGYTGSLGLASPVVLVMISIVFIHQILTKKIKINYFLLPFFIFILISSLILFLSQSIKSLSIISCLLGILILSYINRSAILKHFEKGFLIGLIIFINLHAVSLITNDINFSFASEGISIFGVEIYQSLVSYPMLISYFFSLIILKPEILKKLNIIRDKKVFFYILLVCTLLSSIFVLSVLSRRITLLICVISLVLLLIKNILNLRNKKNIILIPLILSFIISIGYFQNKFFYGIKSINYSNMIKPRLDAYIKKLNEIKDSPYIELFFGKYDGWGNIESGLLDIILNTGLVGFCLIFLTLFYFMKIFFFSISNQIKFGSEKLILFFFFFLIFFMTNIINNSLSTPYFFVSYLILFSIFIKKNHDEF